MDTKPYYFRHFDISHLKIFDIAKPVPIEELQMYMGQEKESVMAYRLSFRFRTYNIPTRDCR